MKVVMVFEFPHITDPNSAEATEIVDALTLNTVAAGQPLGGLWAHVWAGARVRIEEVEERNVCVVRIG